MQDLPTILDTKDGPMAEGASAELLSELLAAFEVELRNQGAPVDRLLRPGAPPRVVQRLFGNAGLVAPEEVVVWFGWHDGGERLADGVSDHVLPLFQFESLQSRFDFRLAMADFIGTEGWQSPSEWVEILGGRPRLAVRTSSTPELPPLVRCVDGELDWGTQPEDTDHQVVSLCTPVTWWIEYLRNGEYRWLPERNRWDRGTMQDWSRREERTRSFA